MKTSIAKWMLRLTALAVLMLTACAGPPPPLPAPPSPSGPLIPGLGSCAPVGGGQPLQQGAAPYNAQLTSNYGATSDSLTVQLFFQSATNATDQLSSIVGSGNLNFPDIATMMQYPTAGQPTSFCVSSTSPSGGTSSGVFSPVDDSVAIVLTGMMNVPSVSPFSGYPGSYYTGGSGGTVPELVTVTIGWSGCAAYLSQTGSRIEGCVDIQFGQGYGAQAFQMFAQ